ncbi:hypothetical protein PanWU01x14_004580 [Parasponia andersonii]|uniref:Uncharacterized protein n=1 Tax=Parasponia andersonii TaxID=3476 RepID=A0A2P5E396_PARAD|nr:hypothetical protein PanWU01x14_004580 [Parasponia andersonii]
MAIRAYPEVLNYTNRHSLSCADKPESNSQLFTVSAEEILLLMLIHIKQDIGQIRLMANISKPAVYFL